MLSREVRDGSLEMGARAAARQSVSCVHKHAGGCRTATLTLVGPRCGTLGKKRIGATRPPRADPWSTFSFQGSTSRRVVGVCSPQRGHGGGQHEESMGLHIPRSCHCPPSSPLHCCGSPTEPGQDASPLVPHSSLLLQAPVWSLVPGERGTDSSFSVALEPTLDRSPRTCRWGTNSPTTPPEARVDVPRAVSPGVVAVCVWGGDWSSRPALLHPVGVQRTAQ